MGKNLGDDLREGKVTLPLIVAMQRGTPQQRDTIRTAIEQGATDTLDTIIAIVKETGALTATREAAAAEARIAIAALDGFPDTPHTAALLQLAAQLLDRRS